MIFATYQRMREKGTSWPGTSLNNYSTFDVILNGDMLKNIHHLKREIKIIRNSRQCTITYQDILPQYICIRYFKQVIDNILSLKTLCDKISVKFKHVWFHIYIPARYLVFRPITYGLYYYDTKSEGDLISAHIFDIRDDSNVKTIIHTSQGLPFRGIQRDQNFFMA